jgi:hypothetical protein
VRAGLVVALVLAVLAAAGCGGPSSSSSDSQASASAWADGFCTALASYKNAVTQAATSVKEGGLSKESLQSAVGSVSDATKTFGADIKALDTPDTSAGASAKKTVSTLADEIQTEADAVRAAMADGAPTLSALSTIQTAITQATNALKTATTELQQLDASSEIRSALTTTPSCSPFFSG